MKFIYSWLKKVASELVLFRGLQFKTFSQRVEEIDIDVYRSLHKVKSEPSEGSSFFRDCLIEWRVCFYCLLSLSVE